MQIQPSRPNQGLVVGTPGLRAQVGGGEAHVVKAAKDLVEIGCPPAPVQELPPLPAQPEPLAQPPVPPSPLGRQAGPPQQHAIFLEDPGLLAAAPEREERFPLQDLLRDAVLGAEDQQKVAQIARELEAERARHQAYVEKLLADLKPFWPENNKIQVVLRADDPLRNRERALEKENFFQFQGLDNGRHFEIERHEMGHRLERMPVRAVHEKFDMEAWLMDDFKVQAPPPPKAADPAEMMARAIPSRPETPMQWAMQAAVEKARARDESLEELGLPLKEASRRLASCSAEEAPAIFAQLQSALTDPAATIVKMKEISDGVNKTYLVTLSNGALAVFKPSKGESQSKLRLNLEKNHQAAREQAAYIVDRALGHFGRVPPTVRCTLKEASSGKVQEGALMYFIPNARTAKLSNSAEILSNAEASDYRRMAILDHVIGNLDRHNGNWMLTEDGHSLPIDHGLSFPMQNSGQGGSNFVFDKNLTLRDEEKQMLQSFLEQKETLTEQLSPLLSGQSIDAMFERVEVMLKKGETSHEWRTGEPPRPPRDLHHKKLLNLDLNAYFREPAQ